MGNMTLRINVHPETNGVSTIGYLEAKINFMTDGGPDMECPPVKFVPEYATHVLDSDDLARIQYMMASLDVIRRSIGIFTGHKQLRTKLIEDDLRVR
jgi:hypothetical protein